MYFNNALHCFLTWQTIAEEGICPTSVSTSLLGRVSTTTFEWMLDGWGDRGQRCWHWSNGVGGRVNKGEGDGTQAILSSL